MNLKPLRRKTLEDVAKGHSHQINFFGPASWSLKRLMEGGFVTEVLNRFCLPCLELTEAGKAALAECKMKD